MATQREMIEQVFQVVLGVQSNPDENGLVGDVKEVLKLLKELNGSVRTNTTWRKAHTWAIGFLSLVVVALLSYNLAA